MSLHIRRATLADVDALSAIAIATYTETWGDSYPPQDLHTFLQDHYGTAPQRVELSDPRSAVWLLLEGETVVGYLAAGANTLPHADARDGDIELKRLYILASHQNGGYGARLMDTFMAWLDQPQHRTLWVGVWEENFGAQRFYARYGCSKAGEYDFIVGDSRDREFILRRP
ncbi:MULTISPECIES: GNAT family N-acetyltransferase [Stenotrophomonas]|uniref:GNAT family N-acetyltransferase n=1 Tax=Stenotrophomonas TaxID=40323 RepID=UPI000D3A7A0C|nr:MULTISPECIES: GNAT family N-acetyltransferase [Stenotrophomonas]PTT42952.1 GNAT family N-acetyltransferase [Stenotrophomonas sp. HMWF022]PTS76723.1 GNAT family N-acetyltransferase [Stenotrophomonas sp. HMWF023]CAH0242837.1 Spermidine/spermine N(1)-acetyltransferase [Stenotrophomonas lactitubi]CAH0255845.1 Spermidine/spermine N(1)-acetyltransferase [Stenotrophomonas lactitubi]CAH0257027.1 Spermidine/spermine N(1)-acetyltransferase [Stenotrophomonas lactitubi]